MSTPSLLSPQSSTRSSASTIFENLQSRRMTVEQEEVLETWLLSHSSDPYPDHEETQKLATCIGFPVSRVRTWFSRNRSRTLTRNSQFQKISQTTVSDLEELPSRSKLQCSSLIIEVGEPVTPEKSSVTLESRALGKFGGGTRVLLPKVNGESAMSSLSALVNVVLLVQRLNLTRRSKLDQATSSQVNAVPAAASQPSLEDTIHTTSGGGIDMESVISIWRVYTRLLTRNYSLWLSQSQESLSSSPATDSVNSFEDESLEDDSGDEDRNSCSTSEGLSSENMISVLRPLFARLPDEISRPLSHDLTLLFDSLAIGGLQERPSHSPSSSSSTPRGSQASGSAGSSTAHTSSGGRGKRRLIEDGNESPGDGDDDQNGDETRKRLNLNPQSQDNINLRWACPFYQRSPHHYCVETEYGDYRKCAKSPGFSGVHRVKCVLFASNCVQS
jgi:Homeobox KN domain